MQALRINNLKVAIKVLEENQQATKSPSLWQSYEEELIELRKKLGELECQTDNKWDNSQEIWTETKLR